MLHKTQPFHQVLDNGLILKSISTEDEIDRLATFNVVIHEEEQLARMTRALILHHPFTHPKEWLFVEDSTNGKIVSSLCLLPWTLHYETVQLKAAEMGIVGTLPEYRHQGLIRSLDSRFRQLLDIDGYVLSHIQGIPYYYRQFGYEYALPLESGWELDLHNIPADESPSEVTLTFRQATADDIPTLDQFYTQAMRHLQISAVRDSDIWHYLIEQENNLQAMQETWLVHNEDREPVGYFRVAKQGFRQGLIVDEASHVAYDVAVAILQRLKQMAIERDKPYIRLSMSAACPLVTIAKAYDARVPWTYAWQIKFPDPARFLRQITPTLEQRVQNSIFAGLTRSVILNLYQAGYELVFDEGCITAVNALGFCENAYDIRIPPMQFVQLALGYRTRDELQMIYPDVGISAQAQPLVDVLFPKMNAFLHLIY